MMRQSLKGKRRGEKMRGGGRRGGREEERGQKRRIVEKMREG